MPESTLRRSWTKRVLLTLGGLSVFVLLFVVACRVAVQQIFWGIEQSKATGLSAAAWDPRSMWSSNMSVDFARSDNSRDGLVSRSAQLRSRTSSFDQSIADLRRVVSDHQGYFDDLRTQSQTGQGRLVSVALAFPATNFDVALSDLKKIGRMVSVAESGEDSAVKLASQARRLASAQTNLARLQKLRRERTDKLVDVLAVEKEIAAANEAASEALRQQEELQSTVALAHISFSLLEDYRAPLEAEFDGQLLELHNSLVEGVGAVFSSTGLVISAAFEYGLPMIFWLVLLFYPARYAWRRFRRGHSVPAPAVS